MYVMKRKGKFPCKLTGGFHCGVHPENTFEYEVELAVENYFLDERGFIVDNFFIHEYFQNIKETNLSCELLSRKAAEDIFSAITGDDLERSSEVLDLSVTIWSVPKQASFKFSLI